MNFNRLGLRTSDLKKTEKAPCAKGLKDAVCPYCQNGPMDGLADGPLGPFVPVDGSPTVCSYCCRMCVIRNKGNAWKIDFPTMKDRASWESEPSLWEALKALQVVFGEASYRKRLAGDERYSAGKPAGIQE